MGVQGLQRLIEVRIAGLSRHGSYPLCEDDLTSIDCILMQLQSRIFGRQAAIAGGNEQATGAIRLGVARLRWDEQKRAVRGGSLTVLRLTRAVYDTLRAHGEETYPHESCGALIGRHTPDGWQVETSVRAGNTRTDSAHNRYLIAPVELVNIEREARGRGLGIAGFYHSHPDHPAHWSPTDLAEAHWLGCSYVITSVAQGKATVTNSFLLAGASEEDKHFEQETILIDGC